MNKLLSLAILIGCNAEKIAIDGGTYSFASINGIDEEVSTDLLLELGYFEDSEGRFSFAVSGQELVSGSYTDAPESDWLTGCNTNFTYTTLQTKALNTAVDFGDIFAAADSFENPILAPGCTVSGPAGEEFPDEIYLYDKSDTSLGVGPCPGLVCLVFEIPYEIVE